nr:immunoglobulin heavy chain junction region [Macaca mulatta]MOV49222.1 immunoglobulin heavy chain junction region [Macaca mulatta]
CARDPGSHGYLDSW